MLFHNWHRIGAGFRCVFCGGYSLVTPQGPCARKTTIVRRARPLDAPVRKAREL